MVLTFQIYRLILCSVSLKIEPVYTLEPNSNIVLSVTASMLSLNLLLVPNQNATTIENSFHSTVFLQISGFADFHRYPLQLCSAAPPKTRNLTRVTYQSVLHVHCPTLYATLTLNRSIRSA